MALIKCPRCGKVFSEYADKCPNCGCSIEECKNPQPTVPQAPVPPVAPQASVPPVAPQAPVPPVAPQASVPPVAPQAPVPPVAPQASVPPVASQAPVPPVAPQTSVPPVAPQAPVPPVTPQASVPPVAPQASVPPVAPVIPQAPNEYYEEPERKSHVGLIIGIAVAAALLVGAVVVFFVIQKNNRAVLEEQRQVTEELHQQMQDSIAMVQARVDSMESQPAQVAEPAAPAFHEGYYTSSGKNLRIRKGPGFSYGFVYTTYGSHAYLMKGDQVYCDEERNGWYHVHEGGYDNGYWQQSDGWVKADYLY